MTCLADARNLLTCVLFVSVILCNSTANPFNRTSPVLQADVSNCDLSKLSNVFSTLRWKNVILFYEAADELAVTNLHHYIEKQKIGFQMSLYDLSNTDSKYFQEILSVIYHKQNNEVRIILFFGTRTFELLKQADRFDEISNKTTNYKFKSRWMVVQSRPTGIKLEVIHLANVILLKCGKGHIDSYTILGDGNKEIICTNNEMSKKGDIFVQPNNCSTNDFFPNIKYRYSGQHLLIGTYTESGFFEIHVNENEDIVYSGMAVELTKVLSKHFNFTYTFMEPVDGDYGSMTKDGHWDGLVGMLDRKEIDMVIANIFISHERSSVIDYILPPFADIPWFLLRQKGTKRDKNWVKLFRPFQTNVYVAILVVFLVISLLLSILVSFNGHSRTKSKLNYTINLFISLLGFVSARGDGIWLKNVPVRIFVFFLWMFCTVVTGVYVGNLTAALADTRDRSPFDSAEELVELSDWRWGIRSFPLNIDILNKSNNEIMTKIWHGLQEFNKTEPNIFSMDLQTHIDRVLKPSEKYAYLGEEAKLILMNHQDCQLEMLDSLLTHFFSAFAVTKNSHFKADLEWAMLRLSDSGIITRLKERRYKDNRLNKCKEQKTRRTIALTDIIGGFLVCGFGLGVALVSLIIELIYKCSNRF